MWGVGGGCCAWRVTCKYRPNHQRQVVQLEDALEAMRCQRALLQGELALQQAGTLCACRCTPIDAHAHSCGCVHRHTASILCMHG